MPSFDAVMQANFVIFMRSMGQSTYSRWYPLSLVYAADHFLGVDRMNKRKDIS